MYVAFEGIDGSGKSAQADLLEAWWTRAGRVVRRSREPDESNPVGKLLRSLLVTGRHPRAHAALFLADRMVSDDQRCVFLERGDSIVQDRSFVSTLVYQETYYPRGHLEAMHVGLRAVPDLVIVLDVPIEVAAERIRQRAGPSEVYETGSWLEVTRERYRRCAPSVMCGNVGVPVVILDGQGTPEEVQSRVVWEIQHGAGSRELNSRGLIHRYAEKRVNPDFGRIVVQDGSEDARDERIARQRLAEIEAAPESVIRGAELEELLAKYEEES